MSDKMKTKKNKLPPPPPPLMYGIPSVPTKESQAAMNYWEFITNRKKTVGVTKKEQRKLDELIGVAEKSRLGLWELFFG